MAHHPLECEPAGAGVPSWDDLRAFLAVAVHGSMNRAAATLGESQPTIGRRMRRLEQQLRLQLFRRGPNSAVLMPAGEALLRAVAPMAEAAREVESVARLFGDHTTRPVKLTTTTSIAMFLSRHLPELHAAVAPRELVVMPTRRRLDLTVGEADIALRMRDVPRDHGLLARKLATIGFAFYGVSLDPRLPVLMPGNRAPTSHQHALAVRACADRQQGPEIDEMHLRYLAVRSGVGIGSLPCWLGDTDPELCRIHNDAGMMVRDPLYLVRHESSRDNPAVDALCHVLAQLIQRHRKWLGGELMPHSVPGSL
jgi:DNA-binding transcriptional LysR family regulator